MKSGMQFQFEPNSISLLLLKLHINALPCFLSVFHSPHHFIHLIVIARARQQNITHNAAHLSLPIPITKEQSREEKKKLRKVALE
jgi:hypothetical protein